MSFSFLRLFKKRRVPSSAPAVDVSVSKVVAPVPGEVRFPFLCYYFAETYADFLSVRSKLEEVGYLRSSRCAAVTVSDFNGCFFYVGFSSYTVTLRGGYSLPAGLVYIHDMDDFILISSYHEMVKASSALRRIRAYWFLRTLAWRPSLSLATINKLILQYSPD